MTVFPVLVSKLKKQNWHLRPEKFNIDGLSHGGANEPATLFILGIKISIWGINNFDPYPLIISLYNTYVSEQIAIIPTIKFNAQELRYDKY